MIIRKFLLEEVKKGAEDAMDIKIYTKFTKTSILFVRKFSSSPTNLIEKVLLFANKCMKIYCYCEHIKCVLHQR